MIKNCGGLFNFVFIFISICFLSPSCINQKSITYFNNLPDSSNVSLATLQVPQPIIQVNDLLTIRVGGESEKTIEYINQYMGTQAASSGTPGALPGMQFQVGPDGTINLPKINKIYVAGLTRKQAQDTITKAYSEYLINPIITVDFNNFKFTILGEVRSPGLYTVTNQQINIFEALAQAGDMTQYSDYTHVKLLRDSNGIRKVVTLNFNDKSILNSPYYYLNRYDIIYVTPKNVKLFNDNFTRTVSIISGVASIITIILVLFKF